MQGGAAVPRCEELQLYDDTKLAGMQSAACSATQSIVSGLCLVTVWTGNIIGQMRLQGLAALEWTQHWTRREGRELRL